MSYLENSLKKALIQVFGCSSSTQSNVDSLLVFSLSMFLVQVGIFLDISMAPKSFFNVSPLWNLWKIWYRCPYKVFVFCIREHCLPYIYMSLQKQRSYYLNFLVAKKQIKNSSTSSAHVRIFSDFSLNFGAAINQIKNTITLSAHLRMFNDFPLTFGAGNIEYKIAVH